MRIFNKFLRNISELMKISWKLSFWLIGKISSLTIEIRANVSRWRKTIPLENSLSLIDNMLTKFASETKSNFQVDMSLFL